MGKSEGPTRAGSLVFVGVAQRPSLSGQQARAWCVCVWTRLA